MVIARSIISIVWSLTLSISLVIIVVAIVLIMRNIRFYIFIEKEGITLTKFRYKGATAASYSAMLLEGGLNSIIGSIMVLLAIRLARDPGDIALLVSAKGIGTIFTLYISGIISDKKGRRGLILIGGVLFIVFILGMMTTSNYNMALLYSFLGGLAHGTMDSPSLNILFDIYGDESGPFMSFTQVFFGGGGMFTALIASILMEYELSYNYLFGFYLIVAIMTILLTAFSKFPPLSSEKSGEYLEIFETKPRVKREGIYLAAIVMTFSVASFILFTWIPVYVQTSKQIAASEAVQALTFYMLGTVVGSSIFSIVLRRIHATQLMSINIGIAAFVLLALIFAKNLNLIYILSFAVGFFLGNVFPMMISLGGELFPEQSGSFSGFLATASTIGGTVTISITGIIAKTVGVEPVLWISLIALMLVVIMSRIFRVKYLNLGKKTFEV